MKATHTFGSVVGFMSSIGDTAKVILSPRCELGHVFPPKSFSDDIIEDQSERKAAIELIDVFHEFRRMKGATDVCLALRNKFLSLLKSFKKIYTNSDRSEVINIICSTVKRHLERFEHVVQKSLLIEMRVFCRKYNYYDGFEPAGTARRSKMPRLV